MKNKDFIFEGFYYQITIVPLPDVLHLDIKSNIMKNRKCILEKVERYMNRELNTHKNNFFDNAGDDFKELMPKDQILESLEITKFVFEQALSISENDSFQINLKREPDSYCVSNSFSDELLAWEANMVIQPVFNQYQAVSKMCSHAMDKTLKDAFERELNNFKQIKDSAYAYLTMTECNVQECVYYIRLVAEPNYPRGSFCK